MVLLAHLKAVKLLSWIPDFVGVAGVGIFFALSGFLITRILIADREAGKGLASFYNRRAARIFPIYYLTLAILLFCWPGKELGWAANFTFNFRFLASPRDYFQVENAASAVPPVAHFWSLCVEEHFYWIWPLAVMFLPLAFVRWLPVVIVVTTPALTYFLADQLSVAGYSTDETYGLLSRMTLTQLPAISIGSLVACHERWIRNSSKRNRPINLGLVLCGIGLTWFAIKNQLTQEMARCTATTAKHSICGGAFLIVLSLPFLGTFKSLRNVGTISYGLYLYHLPIYASLGVVGTSHMASPYIGAVAICLTFLAAVVSFRWFESPILALSRSRSSTASTWPSRYAGALATGILVLLFFLAMSNSRDTRQPLPSHESVRNEIQTIVLGSSHTAMGVACAELSESAYNLASASQDLWYDHEIVVTMIRELPNLKRVIFSVSVFTFRSALSDADTEKWRETLYQCTWNISPRAAKTHYRIFSPAVALAPDEVSRMWAKACLSDEPSRGWLAQTQPKTLDLESAISGAKRHSMNSDGWVRENHLLLSDAIHRCQQHGIECVVISTPTHNAYRELLSPDYVDETKRLVADVTSSTGVLYLDYSADPRFENEDFYDCDHLNRIGAVKFTRILDRDLAGPEKK